MGLLADLHQRDLLKDTLVLWGGEFGPSPDTEGNGRDHNNQGFSIWLAGGGVQKGIFHGSTDDDGHEAIEGRVLIRDCRGIIDGNKLWENTCMRRLSCYISAKLANSSLIIRRRQMSVPRRLTTTLLAFLLMAVLPMIAAAGECSGVLVFKDGSKGANKAMSALVKSGGVTKTFYSDKKGNFTITWSSNSGLEKIYVGGSTAARDIKNGATGLRIVVP